MFGLTDMQQKKLIARDEDIFGLFFLNSSDIFYRYLKGRYFFAHVADIDDLMSDIYVKIWKGLIKYDSQYRLEAYIWSILKNHLKDYFKKKRLDYREEDESGTWVDTTSGEDIYIELMQQQFQLESIQIAMRTLDDMNYQILFLKLVEDMNYDEIADHMGLQKPALRKRYSRALQKLKEILEKDHIDPIV